MIRIYYAYYSEPLQDAVFLSRLKSLPANTKADILKLKKWEDRHARLFSRLLLVQAFKDFGLVPDLSSVKTDPEGKPFHEALHFSISHSGNLVTVAASLTNAMGIDVELVRNCETEIFKSFFREEEWSEISTSSNPLRSFFSYWAQKESLIKADGRGLQFPLKEVRIHTDKGIVGEQGWALREIRIDPAYACWLGMEDAQDTIEYRQVNFYPQG